MKWQELLNQSLTVATDLEKVIDFLLPRLGERAILALQGPLGVGKTEFTKRLCQRFNAKEVASPTFAIHHQYSSDRGDIDHLDLYRLQNSDELETTGFWDLLSAPGGLILIEWPERMDLGHLPWSWSLFLVKMDFLDFEKKKRQLQLFARISPKDN